MGVPKLIGVGGSNPGLKRTNNEDSFRLDNALGLYLLADGMGGAASGELASRLTAETVVDYVRRYVERPLEDEERYASFDGQLSSRANTLLQALHLANSLLYQASHQDDQHKGMGSTFSAVMHDNDHVLVTNVGDSRVFRLRAGVMERLTVDHRLLEDPKMKGVINPGATIINSMGNTLTRAMGVRSEVEPDLYRLPLAEGDLFLVCSDGLSDMVQEEMIASVLQMERNGEQKVKDLIDLALAGGGRDNITVVICETQSPGRLKGLLSRIKGG
ncbi:MAG: protein phosphatase 2C domain-containing protein [Pseudomonadota bacterium]